MKGKLIRKDNEWFVRTNLEGEELDEVISVDYPLSVASKYFAGFGLKEGVDVTFELEVEHYNIEGEIFTFKSAVLTNSVSRVEIISSEKGRLHVFRGDIDFQFQDKGSTLKIFTQ